MRGTKAATEAGTGINTFLEQIAEMRPDYRVRRFASSLSRDDNTYRSYVRHDDNNRIMYIYIYI